MLQPSPPRSPRIRRSALALWSSKPRGAASSDRPRGKLTWNTERRRCRKRKTGSPAATSVRHLCIATAARKRRLGIRNPLVTRPVIGFAPANSPLPARVRSFFVDACVRAPVGVFLSRVWQQAGVPCVYPFDDFRGERQKRAAPVSCFAERRVIIGEARCA